MGVKNTTTNNTHQNSVTQLREQGQAKLQEQQQQVRDPQTQKPII